MDANYIIIIMVHDFFLLKFKILILPKSNSDNDFVTNLIHFDLKFTTIFISGLQPIKMVRMNVLADALKSISNAEKRGKRQVLLRPSSKVII